VVLFKAFQVLHGGLLPKAAEPEVGKAASGQRIEAITLLRFHARPYPTDFSPEALAAQAAPRAIARRKEGQENGDEGKDKSPCKTRN